VGDARAERIQRQVRVLMSGSDEQFGAPQLPASGACVFLDVESDPHDEVLGNKVYLWGVLADRGDGSEPEYWGNLAGPGDEGDKTGWFDFLRHAENLLAHLGDAPFVHYSHYEKTWLRKYAERWGDPDGTAARLGGMLWDMQLQGIRDVFCLPVPSYGLKSVENYVGFERSTQEYGGLWAVVRYHEWLQADREDERERVRDELLRYNREDCEAMRHVLEWIRQAKEGRQSR